MARTNPEILPLLFTILVGLETMKRDKALEVGCGEGHVTSEVLSEIFF